jgi:hypothetical protein
MHVCLSFHLLDIGVCEGVVWSAQSTAEDLIVRLPRRKSFLFIVGVFECQVIMALKSFAAKYNHLSRFVELRLVTTAIDRSFISQCYLKYRSYMEMIPTRSDKDTRCSLLR